MANRVKVIGIMADPGLPIRTAQAAAEGLTDELSDYTDAPVKWEAEVSQETFSLTPQGDIPVMDEAPELRSRYGWDYLVYLTDLPRFHEREPLLSEVSIRNQAMLISIPVMGGLRLSARIRKLVVELVGSAENGDTESQLLDSARSVLGFRSAHRVADEGREDSAYIVLPGWRSRRRLLSGMIRSNRPGRMLPAMSGSITAAAAFGSFGIFYSSVWTLADALHPARLLMIAVIAVALFTGWLIFRNGLWNKRRNVVFDWQGWLDNITTVIMVSTSVVLMYLVLAVGLFGLGLLVINAGHLHTELLHPVSLFDYGKIAWMAAVLGMIAGALGSNFDSDEKIRQATYSKRQNQRLQLSESNDDA